MTEIKQFVARLNNPIVQKIYGDKRIISVPVEKLSGNADEDLEVIFHYGQNEAQPRRTVSVSIGDDIKYIHRWYRVSFVGFYELNKQDDERKNDD